MSEDRMYEEKVMAYVDLGYSVEEAKEKAKNEIKELYDYIDSFYED